MQHTLCSLVYHAALESKKNSATLWRIWFRK